MPVVFIHWRNLSFGVEATVRGFRETRDVKTDTFKVKKFRMSIMVEGLVQLLTLKRSTSIYIHLFSNKVGVTNMTHYVSQTCNTNASKGLYNNNSIYRIRIVIDIYCFIDILVLCYYVLSVHCNYICAANLSSTPHT